MKECRYCGTLYEDQLRACPSCGANKVVTPHEQAEREEIQKKEETNQASSIKVPGINKGKLIGILAAVAALIVVVIVVASAIGKNSKLTTVYPGYSGNSNTYTSNSGNSQSGQAGNDVSALIERANTLYSQADKKEFIEFVSLNESTLSSDSGIMSKYDSAVNEYRNGIISNAQNAYNNNGYEAAISIINTGLSVLNGDSLLIAEKERYMSYAPIDLTTLKPYVTKGSIDVEDSITDNMGNTYRTGFRNYYDKYDFMSGEIGGHDYYIWDIGGKYKTLTAIAAISDSGWADYSVGLIRVYGDDILLYEVELTQLTKPFSISVDITGVTDLKIELYGTGAWLMGYTYLTDVYLSN